MVSKKIELDDDASKILDSMATAYGGNESLAISELLRAHQTVESLLDQLESGQHATLAAQKERAERGFREGRSISWQEVKLKNGL